MLDSGRRAELTEQLYNRNATCSICQERNIGVLEEIWSCKFCFQFFHMNCVKSWAQKSLTNLEERGERNRYWKCPWCQSLHEELPNKYYCFCGKVESPSFNRNIIPHSCGNPCGKKRKATCPHPCPILCHPGPCPPCGAMKTDIKCWSHGNPIAIRCGETNLSCKNPCKKLLSCGIHSCSLECHDGECKPCDKIRTIQCYCGKSQNNTTCNQNQEDPVLCCDGQCGKPHAHCSHLCTQKCHPGNCPSCTVSVRRRCVCGVEEREQCKCASSSPLAALEQFCKIHNSDPFVGKTSLFTTFQPILQSSQSSKDQNTPKTATINLLQPLLLNQLLSQLIRCKRPCGMQLSCGKHKCAKLCCPGHFMNGAVVSMKQNQASHLENVEIRKNTENAASAALLLLQQLVLTNPTSQQSSQSSSSFSSSSSSSSQSSSLSSSQQQNQQLLPADIDALKLIIRQNLTSIHSIQSLLTSLHRCSQICGKLLDCRRHTCQQLCHSGRCDTCHQTQFTSYICPCGRTTMDPPIPCGTPIPLCPFPCSRQRQCGHNDQRNQNHPCHDDDTVCAPCTVYVPKPCIGGHNIMIAVPCHQTAASCGQPCEKLLSCGVHRCKRLCHIGECESNQHQQLLNSSQFGSRQQQGKNTMISILEAFDVDTYSLQQQQSSSQSQSQHSRSKGKISPTPQFISCGGMCQFNRSLCGHPCCETCHPLSYAPTHQQQQQTLSSQSSQQILIPPLHYSPCPLHVPCQHPVLLHCKCGLRSEVQSCNTSLAFPNAFERRIECDDVCDRMKKIRKIAEQLNIGIKTQQQKHTNNQLQKRKQYLNGFRITSDEVQALLIGQAKIQQAQQSQSSKIDNKIAFQIHPSNQSQLNNQQSQQKFITFPFQQTVIFPSLQIPELHFNPFYPQQIIDKVKSITQAQSNQYPVSDKERQKLKEQEKLKQRAMNAMNSIYTAPANSTVQSVVKHVEYMLYSWINEIAEICYSIFFDHEMILQNKENIDIKKETDQIIDNQDNNEDESKQQQQINNKKKNKKSQKQTDSKQIINLINEKIANRMIVRLRNALNNQRQKQYQIIQTQQNTQISSSPSLSASPTIEPLKTQSPPQNSSQNKYSQITQQTQSEQLQQQQPQQSSSSNITPSLPIPFSYPHTHFPSLQLPSYFLSHNFAPSSLSEIMKQYYPAFNVTVEDDQYLSEGTNQRQLSPLSRAPISSPIKITVKENEKEITREEDKEKEIEKIKRKENKVIKKDKQNDNQQKEYESDNDNKRDQDIDGNKENDSNQDEQEDDNEINRQYWRGCLLLRKMETAMLDRLVIIINEIKKQYLKEFDELNERKKNEEEKKGNEEQEINQKTKTNENIQNKIKLEIQIEDYFFTAVFGYNNNNNIYPQSLTHPPLISLLFTTHFFSSVILPIIPLSVFTHPPHFQSIYPNFTSFAQLCTSFMQSEEKVREKEKEKEFTIKREEEMEKLRERDRIVKLGKEKEQNNDNLIDEQKDKDTDQDQINEDENIQQQQLPKSKAQKKREKQKERKEEQKRLEEVNTKLLQQQYQQQQQQQSQSSSSSQQIKPKSINKQSPPPNQQQTQQLSLSFLTRSYAPSLPALHPSRFCLLSHLSSTVTTNAIFTASVAELNERSRQQSSSLDIPQFTQFAFLRPFVGLFLHKWVDDQSCHIIFHTPKLCIAALDIYGMMNNDEYQGDQMNNDINIREDGKQKKKQKRQIKEKIESDINGVKFEWIGRQYYREQEWRDETDEQQQKQKQIQQMKTNTEDQVLFDLGAQLTQYRKQEIDKQQISENKEKLLNLLNKVSSQKNKKVIEKGNESDNQNKEIVPNQIVIQSNENQYQNLHMNQLMTSKLICDFNLILQNASLLPQSYQQSLLSDLFSKQYSNQPQQIHIQQKAATQSQQQPIQFSQNIHTVWKNIIYGWILPSDEAMNDGKGGRIMQTKKKQIRQEIRDQIKIKRFEAHQRKVQKKKTEKEQQKEFSQLKDNEELNDEFEDEEDQSEDGWQQKGKKWNGGQRRRKEEVSDDEEENSSDSENKDSQESDSEYQNDLKEQGKIERNEDEEQQQWIYGRNAFVGWKLQGGEKWRLVASKQCEDGVKFIKNMNNAVKNQRKQQIKKQLEQQKLKQKTIIKEKSSDQEGDEDENSEDMKQQEDESIPIIASQLKPEGNNQNNWDDNFPLAGKRKKKNAYQLLQQLSKHGLTNATSGIELQQDQTAEPIEKKLTKVLQKNIPKPKKKEKNKEGLWWQIEQQNSNTQEKEEQEDSESENDSAVLKKTMKKNEKEIQREKQEKKEKKKQKKEQKKQQAKDLKEKQLHEKQELKKKQQDLEKVSKPKISAQQQQITRTSDMTMAGVFLDDFF